MTERAPEDDLLPGMREAVNASRSKAAATRKRKAAQPEIATVAPVARVLVDLPLAHLDRPFDYAVPASMAEDAVPGCRVKVRFAGQDVDGFLVERGDQSDHTGRLQPLRRVVSREPVLSPQVAELSARGGRALRRHPFRRAAPRRTAPARPDRAATRHPARRRRPWTSTRAVWPGTGTAPRTLSCST